MNEKQQAIDRLREWIKPGDTIYTILRHVSASGMQREISLKLLHGNERPYHLDGSVAAALGLRIGKHDGVVVGGCGMDMGLHLVYNLSATLFPQGFGCIGEGCPSNDHSNGDRDYTPHMSVGGCTQRVCVCHDPSAWTRMTSYQNGCSGCGCHRVEHWHREGGYALRQAWL